MILTTKQNAKYIKYICQGQLERFEKNEPLAKILACIDNNDYTTEPGLKKFAEGLKSNFKSVGYMDNDCVTPIGKDIIKTGKVWTAMRGTHSFGVIDCNHSTYIVQHICDYNGKYNYNSVPSPSFIGEFKCNDMQIREIHLEKNALKAEETSVDVECTYNFDNGKSSYAVTVNNSRFAFDESPDSFSIMDGNEMNRIVESEMRPYCLTYLDGKLKILHFDANNIPLNNAIQEIFETGAFNHTGKGSVVIKNIRLSIENPEIAKSVLLKYLEWNAEKQYCGRSEINRLISDFYTLFDDCVLVECGTSEIFVELLSRTAKTNIAAYLHLMACKDLEPNDQGKQRNAHTISLGGKQKTMKDVVKAIVGDRQNVVSVSIADKYAAMNAAISRAMYLFADVLKTEYNAELILYLNDASGNQKASREINKSFYDRLKTHSNIKTVAVSNNDLKEIHDRYYRIETRDDEYWVTTTNELNALRYDNDYVGGIPRDDIKISTRGQMLDFIVIPLNEEDVRPEVKELLGKK